MIMSAFSKANFPSTSFDFEDSTRGEVLKLTKVVVRFMFLYGADYSDKETQTSSNNCAKLFLSGCEYCISNSSNVSNLSNTVPNSFGIGNKVLLGTFDYTNSDNLLTCMNR